MDYAINSMLVFSKSDVVMEAATGVLGNMCSQSHKNRTKAGKVDTLYWAHSHFICQLEVLVMTS